MLGTFSLAPVILSAQTPPRTILAIGAHAGDAELTMGPPLTAERTRGTRVVILDLTGFPYVEYYDALGRVRGIEARKGRAIAFDVEPSGKRRVLDAVP